MYIFNYYNYHNNYYYIGNPQKGSWLPDSRLLQNDVGSSSRYGSRGAGLAMA